MKEKEKTKNVSSDNVYTDEGGQEETKEEEIKQEEIVENQQEIEYPSVDEEEAPESEWTKNNNILIYKDKGYEAFFGNKQTAEKYASAVSEVRNCLDSSISVYNMVVPTAVSFKLSDTYKNLSSSQPDNLDDIKNSLVDGITFVNSYKEMFPHRDEYLFFGTDHHWTALGAYYGYCAFAKEAGFEPIDINELEKKTINDFVGSYYTLTKNSIFARRMRLPQAYPSQD